jgi:hypothetical protein
MGQNDGGIKRGDREDTGDNEARSTEEVYGGDSDTGEVTGDPSALGGGPGGAAGSADLEDFQIENTGGIDDLTILDADDPALGLTNVPGHPPEDWAADTGPTRVPEGDPAGSTKRP